MKRSHFLTGLIILVIGLCIGIMTGLSASAVIQSVLTTILSLVILMISVLLGLQPQGQNEHKLLRYKIDVLPVGVLVFGLTIGCFSGIYMRTHNVLSPAGVTIIDNVTGKAIPGETNPYQVTALFAFNQNTCDIINGYSGKTLIVQLRAIGNTQINTIIDTIGEDNPEKIKAILQSLCKK